MIRQMFVPEKYGMVSCPDCNGSGKLPKEPKGLEVCPTCGGFGLIKKESQIPEEDKEKGSDKAQK